MTKSQEMKMYYINPYTDTAEIREVMLVGALLVCKVDEEREGELRGLTDDEIAHIKSNIHHQSTRRHPEGWQMLCQVEY